MPSSFEYAVLRVVPRVERGERLNAGVILYCRAQDVLSARVELDRARLLALSPGADVETIEAHLAAVPQVCAGGKAAGQLGRLSQAERFRFLVAPRSTVLQASEVHTGLCTDPAGALDRLFDALVRVR